VSDDLREILYQSATLFTTASHYEGFGMPILEAMHFGTPCAISDIPVFHEVAADAADYFDGNDPKDIADHLGRLLRDAAGMATLGKQGKQQADSFSWKTVAETFYNAIKRTLDEQKH
jgi:glycosyltransferase involved in cell wall biosynthesis